jgi:hypothetical protein
VNIAIWAAFHALKHGVAPMSTVGAPLSAPPRVLRMSNPPRSVDGRRVGHNDHCVDHRSEIRRWVPYGCDDVEHEDGGADVENRVPRYFLYDGVWNPRLRFAVARQQPGPSGERRSQNRDEYVTREPIGGH